MAREFRLPDLGEGLTDAEIVRVLVSEGAEVAEDDPVLLVETEKAQVELPSPHGGKVTRVHVQPGQRVKVGAVLFTFGDGAPASAPAVPAGAAQAPPPPARQAPAAGRPNPGQGDGHQGRSAAPGAAPPAPPPAAGLPPAATPATRRLARELRVDLATVTGTGPAGRITDEDVRRAAPGGQAPRSPAHPAEPATAPTAGGGPAEPARPLAHQPDLPPLPRFEQWGPVEREALRGVRRRSAEHLALSWSVIPHVTQHDQADVTDLEALRQRQRVREGKDSVLTMTAFLVKAVAVTLKAHPRFNASLDAQAGELVLKRYYHVGVAVDTPNGLMVPVLRDADRKRLSEVAAELSALAARARDGKATLDDLRGGTFTVTNTGALGGTGATPIINYPEVAILGVGRARQLPVVRDGQVVPRLVLPLSLAFDHRVIDGMEAARFSTALCRLLEDPERLLFE